MRRGLGDDGLRDRMGAAARQVALSRYTPERRVATLSRLYSVLIGPRASGSGAGFRFGKHDYGSRPGAVSR